MTQRDAAMRQPAPLLTRLGFHVRRYENEDLIKYAFNEDIWQVLFVRAVSAPPISHPGCTHCTVPQARFHVDNLSSAHVYLRLPRGKTMDDIEPDTLEDCAQLVKANSIQGT